MAQHRPAVEKRVIVTNQLDTMSTFALEEDTGEQVFISAKLARNFNITEGDILQTFVIKNNIPENSVDWYAIFVKQIGRVEKPHAVGEQIEMFPEDAPEPKPEAERPDLKSQDAAVMKYLENGIATAKEVGAAIGVEAYGAAYSLSRLHKQGKVARASIRKREDQVKDSLVLWGLQLSDFLPEEEEDLRA